MIKINTKKAVSVLDKASAIKAKELLLSRQGAGNDFLGWLDLPEDITAEMLEECNGVAEAWKQKNVNLVVVIGIGGSYLGAKSVIEALSHTFISSGVKIVFAGNNLSSDYHSELLDLVKQSNAALVVVSKSGTTTEPAVAFRILREYMESQYGREEAVERIVAVTDRYKGALHSLSVEQGYKMFFLEENIGGRFSVLAPVGLLPIALAGFDIKAFVQGAKDMRNSDLEDAIEYAAARNQLYKGGKKIELLTVFNPKLQYVSEWWKQLYGESEGKDGLGIFPASVCYTTDLHSMGQYVQDGERTLFETFLMVKDANREVIIPNDERNIDTLNFLSGKTMEYCNAMAAKGTAIAHLDGGVPNIQIEMDKLDEYHLGQLFYFFEFACGVSAYMLGVNPFDQPGVEDYKKNMFALLGKPGYEELREKLQSIK